MSYVIYAQINYNLSKKANNNQIDTHIHFIDEIPY